MCPCSTLFEEVKQAQRRGEGVSVLFTALPSCLLLMVLIRLLYMITNPLLKIPIIIAHVVKPEVFDSIPKVKQRETGVSTKLFSYDLHTFHLAPCWLLAFPFINFFFSCDSSLAHKWHANQEHSFTCNTTGVQNI